MYRDLASSVFALIFVLLVLIGITRSSKSIDEPIEVKPVVTECELTAGSAQYVADTMEEVQETITAIEEETEIVAEPVEPEPEYIRIGSTAYSNPGGNNTASGAYPTANHTLAGKREWMGRWVDLYDLDYNYLGSYKFEDVGYGRSVGYGESRLHKGSSLGDIEAGETIDIFFDTSSECTNWGRRDVYMVWR